GGTYTEVLARTGPAAGATAPASVDGPCPPRAPNGRATLNAPRAGARRVFGDGMKSGRDRKQQEPDASSPPEPRPGRAAAAASSAPGPRPPPAPSSPASSTPASSTSSADASAIAGYTPEQLLDLYHALLLPRTIEERMLLLLRQGRLSKWFAGVGQEAIAVG